jgi:DNA-binding MarR family transcriptional regulator
MEHKICKIKDVYHTLYAFEKSFHQKNGLTVNEAMVLCLLCSGDTHTAGEVCKHVGLSNSRVSKIINDMERKGWLVRRIGKEDKRLMFFVLTEAGKQKYQEIITVPVDIHLLQNQIIACF